MTVPVDNTAVLTYGATKDDVKAGMAVTRKLEKIANEYKKNVVIAEADRVTALDLVPVSYTHLPPRIWYNGIPSSFAIRSYIAVSIIILAA